KGPFSYTWNGEGWKEFELDEPFNYSGNNSLLIVWVNNDGTYATGYPYFSYTTKTNTGLYKYLDGSFPSIPGTGTITSNRPNIIVDGQKVCSSPRVEVVAIVNPSTPITITDNKTICNNAVDSIEVLTGASAYETFTWSPATNLYTDAACTTPYVSGSSIQKVYFKNNTAGTYEFVCLAENTSTDCATTDTVEITVLPATASIIATPEEICFSGSSTLSISPSDGYGDATFQWASSTDGVSFTDITGANGLSYTTPDITASTYYKWTATASGNTCLTDTVFIKVNNPQILSTNDSSHCGPGTVELSATANVGSTINWYDVAIGGQPLATGETFTTPVLTSTTSYYVEAVVSGNPPITIGDGELTSTGAQSPFYHLWGGKKSQYLIRASELTAAGFTAGNIDILSFEVTSVGTVTFNDFNLSIGSTASTELTTTLLTGLQTVYTNVAYLPVVGENTINFVTPFMWDGTSNIVIEFCWSNNNSGSSTNSAHVKYDNTTFNSTSYIQKDNQLASALCALTTSATTGTTRPKFTLGQVPCASPRVEVIATITEPPAITASVAPNDTICDGEEITLSVTSSEPNYEYTWTYDSQTYSGASFTDSPSASTQYIVNANDPIGGCVNIDTINVTVYPSPSTSVSANPTSIICGESVQLDATGVGYVPTIIVSEDFNETTHSFTAINNSTGGTPEDAAWTLRPDGYSYGSYSPVVFHSNDNTQFIMSNSDDQGSGGTTNTELISPEFSTVGLDSLVLDFYHYFRSGDTAAVDIYDGSQWVNLETYTSTVGSSSSFVHETINLSAYVGLNNVKIRFKYIATWDYYWAIDNVTITGYTPQTISWSSNPAGFTSTIANPVATPITNTTYIATVSNSFGCTDEDSIAITVNPITISINADPESICVGSSTTLTASGAENYTWSDGTDTYTGASIVVSPTITTTYSVTGTTTLGCMNTAEIEITVSSYINKVDDVSICSGESYTWYGNVYNTAGTYYDTIPATMGCDTAAQLNLTILPLPTITANADVSIVCPGAPVVLTATGGESYEWSTTQTGSSITVNPTTATTYTVTGTDANGCENTATVSISVNPLPTVSASATPSELCIGESTTISASGAITYEWDNGETTESFTVTPDETTTYVVTGTDDNGCENTAEITVIVNPLPLIMITADNTTICSGQSVTLTASSDVTGTTYLWDNGLTDAIITQYPTDNTTYAVTATTPAGCESTADIDITVNPSPTVDLGEDIVQCGGTVTLDAGAGFSSYQWNPPLSTSQTMIVSMSGTYSVTVTNEYDCSATDDIVVTISNVTVSLAETENGLEATIDPIVSGSYTWYTCDDEEIPGVTGAIYTNPTIGECYYVVFTDEYDCEFISEQVTVTSIADNVLSNAIVYPVPATDKVIVELINNDGAEVYLYDMLGQLVNSYKMDDSKLTINVSNLSGNFLLKVITPDNTVNNFRIVITK
ncbi:MAG TPA: T9SS type A sorting domain-containing protein, partial [Bacteroidales bacterium]|nr:T9SS type A sorting domain-containing protein [Bacteroidales bacterium]